jgi:hypothetical protein
MATSTRRSLPGPSNLVSRATLLFARPVNLASSNYPEVYLTVALPVSGAAGLFQTANDAAAWP